VKKFLMILTFAFMSFVPFAKCDTINLLGGPSYSYAYVYTFPASSNYASTYGTGIGLIETDAYNVTTGAWADLEAVYGTTVGNVTHFAYTNVYGSSWGNVAAFNSTFNAKTDVFSTFFMAGGKKWHLTETLGAPTYSWYNDGSGYTYGSSYGNLTKAQATTVPEPGTLCLLGTGLISIGLARKMGRYGRQTA
jgi:hypothetical protein